HWFTSQEKLEEAQGVFTALTNADADMVAFTYENVVKKIDKAAQQMEMCVDRCVLDDAETIRLQFKSESGDLAQQLERFGAELSELIIEFARSARVPVTLASDS